MMLSLYDVFGNRLLVASHVADDGALRASNDLARRCFVHGRRIADGVALFAPRAGFLRTAFYNPDGSFERLCGNSLLVAAEVLVEAGQSVTVRPFALPPIELVHSRSGYLEASSEVELPRAVIEVPGFGRVPVFDTGSPHAVVSLNNRNFDLAGTGREFVREADVNLTLAHSSGGILHARTLERGVGAETAACGTGALAVALASERIDQWIDIRYRNGRYRVLIRRAGGALAWTLRADERAAQLERHDLAVQDEAGPSDVSGSSSTRCST